MPEGGGGGRDEIEDETEGMSGAEDEDLARRDASNAGVSICWEVRRPSGQEIEGSADESCGASPPVVFIVTISNFV